MNAGERQALRQVVRQRMKVLRADVAARKAELEAELETRVAERFAARDKQVADLCNQLDAIWAQAMRDARDAVDTAKNTLGLELTYRGHATAPALSVDSNERFVMRRQLAAEIERQVKNALVDIDRREADLIEEITVDGLETEAAKDFLGRIPTVGQLVPGSRLNAIAGGDR